MVVAGVAHADPGPTVRVAIASPVDATLERDGSGPVCISPCDVAPEAAYWKAVCRYKRTHEPNDLLGGWRRTLHTRYPDSQWRTAQAWSEPPLRD